MWSYLNYKTLREELMITTVNIHRPVQSEETQVTLVPEGIQLWKSKAFPRLCSQLHHIYKTQTPE